MLEYDLKDLNNPIEVCEDCNNENCNCSEPQEIHTCGLEVCICS